MMRFLSLSVIALGLLLPISTLAAEYRPSEQVMLYATQEREVAVKEMKKLEEELRAIQSQHVAQELEYRRTFNAMNEIKNDLLAKRESLDEWMNQQVLGENRLLRNIQLVGAPSNVLKIRTRQRQLANARLLFEGERNKKAEALEEKEAEWNSQWTALVESQAKSREYFTSQEANLNDELTRIERDLTAMQSLRIAKEAELDAQSSKSSWQAAQRDRYNKEFAHRTSQLNLAITRAKSNNYLSRKNPEVLVQLQKKKDLEVAQEKAMHLKEITEQLGIVGPINDKLRASLYLHLFGSLPEATDS